MAASHLRKAFCLLAAFVFSGCLSAARTLPSYAQVSAVIDGDTARLSNGRLVRYLGIDAPETHHKEGERWVEAFEPFSREAAAFNRDCVEGRSVRLEYDAEKTDDYGRLLVYVYVDGVMVNERLLEEGLAKVLIIPPNGKYERKFHALSDQSRRQGKGLWSGTAKPPGAASTAPSAPGKPGYAGN